MGRKDLWQSDYFDKNERFADIFNGALFDGAEVILPNDLMDADGEIVSITETEAGRKVICDKVKRWHGGYLSVLTLENQSYVDYRMVFRVMKEEALGYEKQWKDKKYAYQLQKERLDGHEFLSGIKRDDKFIPIITLVLYLGNDTKWDGAESLHEMLDMKEALKPYVSEYKINLFDYHRYNDFSTFGPENRLLFELLSASDDEDKMAEALIRNRDLCNRMDRDSINAIIGVAGIDIDVKELKKYEDERGMYSMCKAFEDHRKRGYNEGKAEGYTSGKAAVIENMLRHNMADELITTLADCTQEFVNEVRQRLVCS